MTYPVVSAGLVTWNSADCLPACLELLHLQQEIPFELVVVDNNSSDDSRAIVDRLFPSSRVVRNNANLGFCAAHNQAIRLSTGRYYLALNPDIVLQPGYLAAMVEAIQAGRQVGMAAGKLLLGSHEDVPPRIDSTGLFLDRKRRQYLRGFKEPDQGQYDMPGEVFGVDGAAPLYRRTMLEDICIDGQYFDEMFFAHKEDVDVSWRARIAGWTCRYTPNAVAYHKRTFRPGQRVVVNDQIRFHAVKNRYLLLLRNESRAGWKRDWLPILWYDLQIFAYLCLFERSSLKATAYLWRSREIILDRRKKIWSRCRVTSEEMTSWFK